MNLIFTCPYFFEYHNAIKQALLNYFNEVYFIFDNGEFDLSFSKIKTNIGDNNIDYFFIIKGEFITPNIIKEIKNEYRDIKIIIFQWDSFNNNPNGIKLIDFVDEYYSFDYEDCKKYNLKYKSNFYKKIISAKKTVKNIDLLYTGKFFEHRFFWIKMIHSMLKDNFNFKVIILTSVKRLFYQIMLNPLFCRTIKKWFVTNPISVEKYNDLMLNSKCVLDIQHHKQTGLTMRCFESLAAGCKLITTNRYIKNESFFNSSYIFILTENTTCSELNSFLKNESAINLKLLDHLEINNWTKSFFKI